MCSLDNVLEFLQRAIDEAPAKKDQKKKDKSKSENDGWVSVASKKAKPKPKEPLHNSSNTNANSNSKEWHRYASIHRSLCMSIKCLST